MRDTTVFEILSVARNGQRWGRVDHLPGFHDLGAQTLDLKGLLALDHESELMAVGVLVQREPASWRHPPHAAHGHCRGVRVAVRRAVEPTTGCRREPRRMRK